MPPTRPRLPTSPRCTGGNVGWWRPSGGCDHDECEFAELDVGAWRAELEDPITRLLARYGNSSDPVAGPTSISLATDPMLAVAE